MPSRSPAAKRTMPFDSFFCRPGLPGAHEKGGVEGVIGRFRRRHLTPPPAVASNAALNGHLAAADDTDDGRVITGRNSTVGAAFAQEQPRLAGLPAEAFDPAIVLSARVDSRARVSVRQSFYSVPARLVGRRVTVRLTAGQVDIQDGGTTVGSHERAAGRHQEVLVLDHYLEVLKTKPGALPGATALVRARRSEVFTAAHQGTGTPPAQPGGTPAGPAPSSRSCSPTAPCRPQRS